MTTDYRVTSAAIDPHLDVFLTAYDPSDLPGGSLDPLGFERGYLYLADKILPGLTNVAQRPRYFSVLCAGASLARVDAGDTQRAQYQKRLDGILRFERFWALANVLASQESDDDMPVSGIRGVTYVATKAESILRDGDRRVSADFKVLSRQVPYGVVGIYGAVADGMRLLDRKIFSLTPDLGERLAKGFLTETETPASLLKAISESSDMPVEKLKEWGLRAHISGKTSTTEQACLSEALHRNPTRSRMATLLAEHPFQAPEEDEITRFKRMLPALARDKSSSDLHEAVLTILAYESCYQLALLGFQRLLWLCRSMASINPPELNSDTVLRRVCAQLPSTVNRFMATLDDAQSEQFLTDINRLEDVRMFLNLVAASCSSPALLTQVLMARHADVQKGKFDRGRPKMPWLEVMAGRISLSATKVGGLDWEATKPGDISPHPYRLAAADALITAAGGQ